MGYLALVPVINSGVVEVMVLRYHVRKQSNRFQILETTAGQVHRSRVIKSFATKEEALSFVNKWGLK